MNDLKLSVIIPVYNQEKYLGGCLDSLAAQSLEEMEVIIVDDGSTDSSLEIARTYARYNDLFMVISLEKRGQSAARNAGLRHARGKYIGFVDSDDFVDPAMYEQLYRAAVSKKSDMVCCGAILFDNKTRQIMGKRTDFDSYTEIEDPNPLFKRYLKGGIDRVIWNGIYHRQLFRNLRFPDVNSYADQYVTPQILAKSNKYLFLDHNFYYYRQHPGAVSFRRTNYERIDRVQSLNLLYRVIDNHDLNEEVSEKFCNYTCKLILAYHNQVMYSNPLFLKHSNHSVANVINREVFDYLFDYGNLDRKQFRLLKLIIKSHYLGFLWHKLVRIKEILIDGESLISDSKRGAAKSIVMKKRRYRLLVQRYA